MKGVNCKFYPVSSRYDRGNLVLTDWEFKILNILRPRVAGEEKFLVRETYPVELCKQDVNVLEATMLETFLSKAKDNDTLKKGSATCCTIWYLYFKCD